MVCIDCVLIYVFVTLFVTDLIAYGKFLGKLDMSEAVRAFEVIKGLMAQAHAISGGQGQIA